MKKLIALFTICLLALTGCSGADVSGEPAEELINVEECAGLSSADFIETYGEPTYTEAYEYDGFVGTLYDFESVDGVMTEAVFNKNDQLHVLTLYVDKDTEIHYNNPDEFYALFGLSSSDEDWRSKGFAGTTIKGDGGTGNVFEFEVFIKDHPDGNIDSGNIDNAKFIYY